MLVKILNSKYLSFHITHKHILWHDHSTSFKIFDLLIYMYIDMYWLNQEETFEHLQFTLLQWDSLLLWQAQATFFFSISRLFLLFFELTINILYSSLQFCNRQYHVYICVFHLIVKRLPEIIEAMFCALWKLLRDWYMCIRLYQQIFFYHFHYLHV